MSELKPVLTPKTTFPMRRPTGAEKTYSRTADFSFPHEMDADFLLLDGPPYANGEPHLGHFLNKSLKDLLCRVSQLRGETVSFKPGWDCFGLPLELAVEKKHGRLPAEKAKEKAKTMALRAVAKSRALLKQGGVRAQWDSPYLTLSEHLRTQTYDTLRVLFSKGLLTYSRTPVHVCPKCASSLSDAELEVEQKSHHSLYFLVRVNGYSDKPTYAVVWTTTPWTVPMNQGLAFNPDLEYCVREYDDRVVLGLNLDAVALEGEYVERNERLTGLNLSAENPLTGARTPVFPAEFVKASQSGFVHVVVAHGPDDFVYGRRAGLETATYVGSDGLYRDLPASLSSLSGKGVGTAAPHVLDLLQERGLFLSHEESVADTKVCWRHKAPVFYLATPQLFLNLDRLKPLVEDALASVDMREEDRKLLQNMMLDRPNWCLSRQRAWGNPVNLWVSDTLDLVPENSEWLEALASNDQDRLAALNDRLSASYTKVTDVFDVWFDSGNLGVAAYRYFGRYPDVVLEGRDQFRGWFQSLMWLSLAYSGQPAFRSLYSHGFVLDKNRDKLSKSKGAGGLQWYYQKYGADTLRLWAAHASFGQDLTFSDERMADLSKVYDRFRMTFRYLHSNLFDYDGSDMPDGDSGPMKVARWLVDDVRTATEKLKALPKSSFKEMVQVLYTLCDNTLSGLYFEALKGWLYVSESGSAERRAVQAAFAYALNMLATHVEVFCPLLVSEVKSHGMLALSPKCAVESSKSDAFAQCVEWSHSLPEWSQKGSKMELRLGVPKDFSQLFEEFDVGFLASLLGVSEVYLTDTAAVQRLPDLGYTKCKRCWKYSSAECASCRLSEEDCK